MEPAEIEAILRKETEEYNRGNWEYMYNYVADSFVYQNFTFPDVVRIEANKYYDRAIITAFTYKKLKTKINYVIAKYE